MEKFLAIVGPWSFVDSVVKIEDTVFDTIPSRVYIPYNRSNDGAIIFIHGGGFVLGNMNMYESFIRQVAKNSRMVKFFFLICCFSSILIYVCICLKIF